MNILTIGDYFERIAALSWSAVDHGMDVSDDELRREITKELDCFLGTNLPPPHECDALVGAIAMLLAAGYARGMNLKQSMIRWLKEAANKPGGVYLPNGRRATGEDVAGG